VTETGNTAPPTGAVSFLDTNHSNAILGKGTLGSATRGVAWSTVNSSAPSVAGVSYAVADLNGDGIPDLFVKDYFGTYDVLLGNGDGTFTVKGSPFGPSSETGSFIVGDFNNDGIPDVAAINAAEYAPTGNVTIFLGNGDGTFTVEGSSPTLGYNPTAIATADINGDGNADLILVQQSSSTSSSGQVVIFVGNGDGTFTQASSTTTVASVAYSILPADLNGDGKIDLVLTSVGSTGNTILLGNGDGTFTISAGPGQSSESMMAVADVNNDGIPDLVFPAASTSYLTVFLGNGDGTFTAAPSNPNLNVKIGNFAIGDFNRDGIPDIVYTNPYATTAAVLLGNGDGTFVPTPGTLSYPYDFSGNLVVADFNGDGWPDVLTEDGNSRTVIDSLTQPTETATTSAAVSIAAAGAHLAGASYPGDSNYNASTSGTISLWGVPAATTTTLGISSGGAPVTSVTPGTVVTLAATVQVGASPLTGGQVNFCDASGIDCTDIHLLSSVALSTSGTATYKFIPGAGVHSYKAVFVRDGYGLTSSSAIATLTVGPAPSPVYSDATAISVNGFPGDYSLTATVVGYGGSASPTGSISFLDTSFGNASLGSVNLGSSTAGTGWTISLTPPTGSDQVSEVEGDFNGDGIPDLAVLWSTSTYATPYSVTILFGKGDGTFTAGPTSSVNGAQEYPTMIAGDFNGDGKTDLAVLSGNGYSSSYITTMLGNGDGTFAAPQTATIFGQGAGGGYEAPETMVAADFNGDGKLDLAIVGSYVSPGGVAILLGNGDGTFSAPGSTVDPSGSFGLIATGDFNGDGIPDLIATNLAEDGGGPTILLGKGDGTFTSAIASFPLDYYPKSIVVGDFNGDGVLDLGFSDLNGIEIALGNGDGTFKETAASPISVNSDLAGLALGDFNHDGKLDIACIGNFNGFAGIVLLTGAGDGTFTVATTTISTIQNSIMPTAVVAADFNGDGVPDLGMLTQNADAVSILLTEPTETATATINGVAPIGAGTHNVEASYPGDGNYPPAISSTVALTAGLEPLVISPAGGTYSTVQTITISEPISGATIYFAASGTVNTNGYIPYTGPIQLTEGGYEFISAYATETGYQESNSVSETYILDLPAAPAPVFSPLAGTYSGTQTVSITDAAPGATIYYTTNGTVPGTTQYTGPITVSSSETLAATAIASGYSMSVAATAQYLVTSASTPLIYTIAGNEVTGYTGDGGPATVAELNYPAVAIRDSIGNLYIADSNNNVVRKVAAGTGIITTIAGNGTAGYIGDNGAATSAELNYPFGLAFDGSGDLFIADEGNSVVREINATTGVITTIAGNGTAGFAGDNNLATGAELNYPHGLGFDSSGNLYIADTYNGRIRKVAAGTEVITTIAGIGYGYSGDGGPATSAGLSDPFGVTADSLGNLYISDTLNNVIRMVNVAGTISTIAGHASNPYNNYPGGYSGDGGPATSAQLFEPFAVAIDGAGNIYIADTENGVIREVTASNHIINTVAGNGPLCYAFSGDGGAATSADLCYPQSVFLDNSGNLIVADTSWNRVREITAPAVPPSTAAAEPTFSVEPGTYTGTQTVNITDSTPGAAIYVTFGGATPTTLSPIYNGPISVTGSAIINALALAPGYLASASSTAAYTITTPPTSIISTVAGNGVTGFSGQGGPATGAEISLSGGQEFYSQGITMDSSGNLYFADSGNNVVWMVAADTGIISVVAGNGSASFPSTSQGTVGDGGLATSAELNAPSGIAVDSAGNIYISDPIINVVRKVSASTGIITTIAGTGQYGGPGNPLQLGNGGPAISANLYEPTGLAVDAAGDLYITDYGHGEVREVSAATGIITAVAGNGGFGATKSGVAATDTPLYPTAIALDSAGNLYIAQQNYGWVNKVSASTGILSIVAGNGKYGQNNGDGGLATNAAVVPCGIGVDGAGDLYIATWTNEIRKVSVGTGIITKVAGNGYASYSGDGGSATVAGLNGPTGIALDAASNIYFGDIVNDRIRKVTFTGPAPAPSFSLAAGTYVGVQTVTISASVQGASIYYSTDGSTPTTASNLYSGPITVSQTETLQAIAVATGYTESAVASAAYVITPGIGTASATVTVTPSGTTITYEQSLTVKVAVGGASGQATPTGTVTLASGSYTSQQALSGGAASFNIAAGSLSSGTDTLTATYSGDPTYAGESGTVTVTVSPVTIAIPTPSPVSPGGSTTATATFTAGNNYSGTMNLTCTLTGSPTGAQSLPTCSLNPASITLTSGGSGTSTLTVDTTEASTTAFARPHRRNLWGLGAGGALLAGGIFFCLPLHRRRWISMFALMLLIAGAGCIGCGDGGGGQTTGQGTPATTAGNYTFTVTGTDSANPKITVSTTVSVAVQ
jgi:sugar lactone lactonase YvrE